MNTLPLGRTVSFTECYEATLLFPIARSGARAQIDPEALARMSGNDLWNCYEFSWLYPCGKPSAVILQIAYSSGSPNIIESKSLKLYLNSFSGTRFADVAEVSEKLLDDLRSASGDSSLKLKIVPLTAEGGACMHCEFLSLDTLEILPISQSVQSDLLCTLPAQKTERLYSDLLRSLCPVTNQPDWATVLIYYSGAAIPHQALLSYIVSFRSHQGFHEECCERIFADLLQRCQPHELAVGCFFTRRGGIDINPIRSTANAVGKIEYARLVRQ